MLGLGLGIIQWKGEGFEGLGKMRRFLCGLVKGLVVSRLWIIGFDRRLLSLELMVGLRQCG